VDEKPDEKQDDNKHLINVKFKQLAIKNDIPIDFWKKQDDESDEPMILEIKDANEGVPSRGKCIVCYKPVYENDADLFACPNCAREAHYLCATIFITEHQICPVCSSKLEIDKKTGKYNVVKR